MIAKHIHKTILNLIKSGLYMTFIVSCTEFEREAKVETGEILGITATTASVSGNIIDTGDGIIDYGHCWSLKLNPTISDSKTAYGKVSKTDSFTSQLNNLKSDESYYVKAYATNSTGTVYGKMLQFRTLHENDVGTINDIDGNNYRIVRIGNQYWMKSNLVTTKYNDGTNIELIDQYYNTVLGTPGYCWSSQNDVVNSKATFGAYYNWYSVNTKKLCPVGWHIPSVTEWMVLINYLGGPEVAMEKLKNKGTVYWEGPINTGTNESGFTALPGGYFNTNETEWGGWWGRTGQGIVACFWTSSENSTTDANFIDIYLYSSRVNIYSFFKDFGLSVRCLKD